jgi:hypothetical protein
MKLTLSTGILFAALAYLSGCSSDSSDKGTGGSTSGGSTSGGSTSGGGTSSGGSSSTQVCCINKRFYKCATAADCEKNLESDVCPADPSQDAKCTN